MELAGAKKFFFMCHCPIFYCKAQLNTAFQRNLFFHFFVSVVPLSTSFGGTILVLSLLLSPKSALFRWMQKSDGLAVFRAFQNAEPSSAHQLIYGSKIILSKAKQDGSAVSRNDRNSAWKKTRCPSGQALCYQFF